MELEWILRFDMRRGRREDGSETPSTTNTNDPLEDDNDELELGFKGSLGPLEMKEEGRRDEVRWCSMRWFEQVGLFR